MESIFVCLETYGHEAVCSVETARSTEGLRKLCGMALVNVAQRVSRFFQHEHIDLDVCEAIFLPVGDMNIDVFAMIISMGGRA